MFTRAALIPMLACLTLLAPTPAPAAARGGEQSSPEARIPPERLEDQRARVAPRQDESQRSPGLRLTINSFVSVQVNVDSLGQNIVGDAANEPSIAVNPVNPNNMVIGWRQFDSIASNFRQAGWSYTMDGGVTWTFPGVLTPGVFRSDPVLDTDSNGNFYYQSLKETFLMDVFKSTDGGVTWGPAVASFGGDKNWMIVDKSSSIGSGHVYGVWRAAFGCCGSNVFTRSVDAGASFENPVPVDRSPGLGTMAVGPDGEVYVTGIDELGSGAFVSVKSVNARDEDVTPTFNDVTVPLGGDLIFGGSPNPGGLIGQVNIAVDRSPGPTRGNVYLLSTVDPDPPFGSQPAAVHISRSVDGGATWSTPVRVNDDPGNNGAWHWFAAHSVSPNRRIDAIWNDTRNTGTSIQSQLFYSYSYDEGETWSPNVQVSPTFNSTLGWPNQNKIGDYYTIVSDARGANVAYSATFNGEQDVYYVRVFPDCNDNGVSDVEDTVDGSSTDCNFNFIPDECEGVICGGPAGTVPDGKWIDGEELVVAKAEGGEIVLDWDRSCKAADTDYAIYEGDIEDDFTSHKRKKCGTSGETTYQIDPGSGDHYYLVVPTNLENEGSYGKNSADVERLPASDACLPQLIGVCLSHGGGL